MTDECQYLPKRMRRIVEERTAGQPRDLDELVVSWMFSASIPIYTPENVKGQLMELSMRFFPRLRKLLPKVTKGNDTSKEEHQRSEIMRFQGVIRSTMRCINGLMHQLHQEDTKNMSPELFFSKIQGIFVFGITLTIGTSLNEDGKDRFSTLVEEIFKYKSVNNEKISPSPDTTSPDISIPVVASTKTTAPEMSNPVVLPTKTISTKYEEEGTTSLHEFENRGAGQSESYEDFLIRTIRENSNSEKRLSKLELMYGFGSTHVVKIGWVTGQRLGNYQDGNSMPPPPPPMTNQNELQLQECSPTQHHSSFDTGPIPMLRNHGYRPTMTDRGRILCDVCTRKYKTRTGYQKHLPCPGVPPKSTKSGKEDRP